MGQTFQHCSQPSFINQWGNSMPSEVPVNHELDAPPTLDEMQKAISQLSNSKAPGTDAIQAEVYKYGGPVLHQKLVDIFKSIWQQGTVLQDFKNALIIYLYKRKGNHQKCDNHHSISLLSITGKVLARVMLNCLTMHLEKGLLPESQCSFCMGWGTRDMIFAVRQLQEKCQEQRCDMYTTFVDLTKAFDTVSRDRLWKILAKYGCPEKFISIVWQFHDGMRACVQDNGDILEAFVITNRVKQGSVLSPILLCLMLLAMLQNSFYHTADRICIIYWTDRKLYNQCHLKAVIMVKQTVIRDFLFTDDCTLNATSEHNMQDVLDRFSTACDNFGLTISKKKTKVMFQPTPGKPYLKPHIAVNDTVLNDVETFTCLGSTISRHVNIDVEVTCRLAKASSIFGRLQSNIWDRRGISLTTKMKVYWAIVITMFLYAGESWTIYSRHARQLNKLHMSCLCKLLRIKWQDKIPIMEVLLHVGMPSIHTLLSKVQVRWAGHVSHMSGEHLPKRLLYGELAVGKCPAGRPKMRFKDSLKTSLENL